MNPLTNMKNVKKLSEQELRNTSKSSWHDQYKDSAWIFVGGLSYDLTEGDVICVFSQYGEIVNINFVRDKDTGKFRGFCFICYEDQRSTILAVDNFNGIKLCNRTIRVDHVSDYKMPKNTKKTDPEIRKIQDEGVAPKAKPIEDPSKKIKTEQPIVIKEEEDDDVDLPDHFKLPPRLPIGVVKKEKIDENEENPETTEKKHKKKKKEKRKKEKKKKKKKRKHSSSGSDSSELSEESSSEDEESRRKKNKK